MNEPTHELFLQAIDQYIDDVRRAFQNRIGEWHVDICDKEVNEVVGGLLARQLSLATSIAKSPPMWNMHVLPVVLRCMADVYITFCWIVKDIKPRSRQFVEYGLGQEKLAIEKYRENLPKESARDPKIVAFLELREKQLDAERYRFLIPVNIGSWNETSIRDMAIEVGEKHFYDMVFVQFSAPVHSTWQHIWRWNLVNCTNPLHLNHRVPWDPDLPVDLDLFLNSAKYLCKTLAKFDTDVLGSKAHNDAYNCLHSLQKRFAAHFKSEDTKEGKAKSKRKTASDSTPKANAREQKRGRQVKAPVKTRRAKKGTKQKTQQ
jgi:hypothetical protein